MFLVSLCQSKGGVGKTTLAVQLAGEVVRAGRSVTVVDADPQGSASRWAELRKLTFPVAPKVLLARHSPRWTRDVLKLRTDVVIVDTPAGLGPTFETAVYISDLLLVPCCPSSLDIIAAESTIAEAKRVRRDDDAKTTLRIAVVPNRIDLSTDEGRDLVEELGGLGEPVAPWLSYDVDYIRSFTSGTSVSSLSEDAKSATEVREFGRFVMRVADRDLNARVAPTGPGRSSGPQ